MVSITANSTLGNVSKAIAAIQKPPKAASVIRLRYSALIGSRLRRTCAYARCGQSRPSNISNAHSQGAAPCSRRTAATHSTPIASPITRIGYRRLPKLMRRDSPRSLSIRPIRKAGSHQAGPIAPS